LIQYTAVIAGGSVEIDIDDTAGQIRAIVDDREYSLEAIEVEPNVYWFKSENASFEVAVVREGGAYIVSIGRHRIPVEILDPRKALLRATHDGHDGVVEIRAPMPGKIVRILAKENTAIAANSGIVVMEAMKMQNEIKSPKAGTVRRVGVREGAAVNAGDLIAVVE